MKAPSAKLRPARSVSQASPSVISSRLSMNSSSLLRRTTRVSHQRMTPCPPVSSTVTRTVALSSARPRAPSRCSGDEPSAGTSTRSGTTARSWNSKMPITLRPCSLSISARSDISFTTMAVLLMDNTPASAKAVCQPTSHTPPNHCASSSVPPNPTAMVTATCSRPSPNTWARIARNFGRLNSRPMANIRNTTPNSPRWRTLSELLASARAFGPISTPAMR